MKKSINRTTVIIVLAVFLTLSIGYALFSDTITIEGTATAQGTFDIEASCYAGIAPTGNYDYSSFDFETEHGYEDGLCQVTNDVVSFSTKFNYPGATRYFTIKLTNSGTIAGKVNMEKFYNPSSMNFCLDGKNGEMNDLIEDDECISIDRDNSGAFTTEYEDMSILIKPDGTEIINTSENLNELMSNFLTSEGDVKLEPGASIYAVYRMSFNDKLEDYGIQNKFNTKLTTTYNFDFEQLAGE